MKLSDKDILLNDSHLLALNKPQGIMVEKDAFGHASLIDLATEYLSKGAEKKEVFLQNVHRLDRPVSGVVLFAKKPSALKHLQQQFEKKKVQKIYLALTDKRPAEEKGLLNHFHYKDVQHKKAIISSSSSPNYSPISLKYELLAHKKDIYCWKINLLTGKYHQIRAQFAYIGCPILGDKYYGSSLSYQPNAIALHALGLQFAHPKTNQLTSLFALPPNDALWAMFSTEIHLSEVLL